jgi:hypothetical protein
VPEAAENHHDRQTFRCSAGVDALACRDGAASRRGAVAADASLGINRVADAAEVACIGRMPKASFRIDFKPGFGMGQGATMVSPSLQKGTHGYSPSTPRCAQA